MTDNISALEQAEELYRLMFLNAHDAILVHEAFPHHLGKILEVNSNTCKMLGYFREELLGMDVSGIYGSVPDKENPDTDTGIITSDGALFEAEFLTKEGDRIPVEVSARVFDYQEKQTVLLIIRDISERKYLKELEEEAMSQIEKSIDQIAMCNDTMRSPLTVISSLNEMNQADHNSDIQKQVKVIDDLIKKIDMRYIKSMEARELLKRHRNSATNEEPEINAERKGDT